MSEDSQKKDEHEDELRLWAEIRPEKRTLVLTVRHNGWEELELAFDDRWLLLAEHQWKLLLAFLQQNRP